MPTSKRQAKYAIVFVSAFVIACVGEVKARTAIGQVSATVISAVASTPIEIRLKAAPLNVRNTSTGFGFARFQPFGGGQIATAQPTVSLIEIDVNGVASFSVSGDATSSYVVRSARSDSSVVQSQTIAQTGASPTSANVAGGLIIPAQALIGGGRLSIEISEVLLLGQGGNTIVEINYN